jgi:hypothetical protein
VGDLAELGAPGESDGVKGPFDVMWAADSVLDVLDHDRRREVLEHWRTLLARDGLLIFSSHNLASLDARAEADRSGRIGLGDRLRRLTHRPPAQTLLSAAHWPTRAEDHAVINDLAHDYAILHYYVRRDAQQRMLRDSGYELIDCLELDGRTVAEGHDGYGPSLYYVARPSTKSVG